MAAGRAVQSFVAFKNTDTRMAMFEPEMGAYLSLGSLSESADPANPHVRGKLVTVDVGQSAVDSWTYPKLSKALQAATPDEVGTVALIRWDWKRIGAYVDPETNRETGEAFVSAADVTLVDLADRRVIARAAFEGDPPAGGLTREGDDRSERPMFKIVEWLEGLPRR